MTSQGRPFADISVNFDYFYIHKHFESGNFETCRFPSNYSTPEIRTHQAKRFTVCPHQRGDEHSKQTMGFCNQTALLRVTRISTFEWKMEKPITMKILI